MATEPFAIPGDAQWQLGGFFSPPGSKEEAGAFLCVFDVRLERSTDGRAADACRGYLRQAREETGTRLLAFAYGADGAPNKLWMAFSRRKFMSTSL